MEMWLANSSKSAQKVPVTNIKAVGETTKGCMGVGGGSEKGVNSVSNMLILLGPPGNTVVCFCLLLSFVVCLLFFFSGGCSFS